MTDRTKPPEGLYDVWESAPGYWSWAAIPDDKVYESEAACLESCWAHHDAIELKTRLRVLAKLIAWLRTNEESWCQDIADDIEKIALKGAMESTKECK